MKFKVGQRVEVIKENIKTEIGERGEISRIDTKEAPHIYYVDFDSGNNYICKESELKKAPLGRRKKVTPTQPTPQQAAHQAVDYHENIYIHIKKSTLKTIGKVLGGIGIIIGIIYPVVQYGIFVIDYVPDKISGWQLGGLILMPLIVLLAGSTAMTYYVDWVWGD